MRKLLNACFFMALLSPSLHGQQQAVQSDSFVDSVGVNIHLHYTDTPYYNNFPLIQQSLVNMGVRHTRDGLVDNALQAYYDRHNALGKLGIKGIYISNTTETAPVFEQYPALLPQAFEGFENPNELDGTDGWVATLKGFMPTLYSAAAATTPHFPVIGPSLTQTASYPALGDQSAHFDLGNIHNYYAGRNPGTPGWGDNGYGSIATSLINERMVAGNKPIWATESGYDNNPTYINYVSEAISARYMPRLLLEHFNAGIQRTYLYELLSEGGSDFGLMRADGTYKPAYYAVSNLLNLLSDKGVAFKPGTLDYTLSGGDASLHHLLLQKRDGTFYLALWVEAQDYDPDQHFETPSAPQHITLQLKHLLATATRYQWQQDGSVTTTSLLGLLGTIPLTVTGEVQIIKLASQPVCMYSIGGVPANAQNGALFGLPNNASSGALSYSAPSGCTAQPVSSASWLTLTRSGNLLQYSASANTGSARMATVTLGDNEANVVQAAGGSVFVQVNSNVPNANLAVDGTPVRAGTWLVWNTGEHHTLTSPPQLLLGLLTYLFNGWTGGVSASSNTVTVTAPASTTIYNANLSALP